MPFYTLETKRNFDIVPLLNLLEDGMKDKLHSACLLLLFSFFFIAVFAGVGNASKDTYEDPYNFSIFEGNDSTRWGKIGSPISDYNIWGYTGKLYNFTVNYTALSPENTTMVFYWNCSGNKSDHSPDLPLNDRNSWKWIYPPANEKNNSKWKYPHLWNKSGTYLVAVGIFNGPASNISCPNISYWVPIEIKNNTTIKVQNIFMTDEKKGFEGNYSDHLYNNCTYCGYVNNDYSFSVKLNATSLEEADNRTINETTTVVYWNYTSILGNKSDNSILGNKSDNSILGNKSDNSILGNKSDNSILGNKSDNSILRSIDKNITSDKNLFIEKGSDNSSYYITWNENFTHQWDETGEKNISATTYHWDPLDGDEMYSNNVNQSILIIRDPKNFISYPIIGAFSNLQNWGIFLVATSLMILFFTYTKNKVPIEISLFGLKPLRLKSVDTLAGIFAFVAGMYLYFVFGRCPWDIPIVGNIGWLDWLSNLYFGMLYFEYKEPNKFSGIPFLSIFLGLVIVFALSLLIYMVWGPRFKGELKPRKLTGEKDSSASAQPEPDPHPVKKRMDLEKLTALIEKEKDPVILQQLYFVRFRYLGDSVEKAASTLGISVGKALNLQELWNESGYEGFQSERKGENISLQELTTLIKNEKDTRVLRALYFIRLRYLRNSVETAASRLGISEETGQRLEKTWKEGGYEGLRELEPGGRKG